MKHLAFLFFAAVVGAGLFMALNHKLTAKPPRLPTDHDTPIELAPQSKSNPHNHSQPSQLEMFSDAVAEAQKVSEIMAAHETQMDDQISESDAASEPSPLRAQLLINPDGTFLKANQASAIEACAKLGMHLPTIRELISVSHPAGAKAVIESSAIREVDMANGFSAVSPTDDGKKSGFYYNKNGYVAPESDLRSQLFWSSSNCVGCVQPTHEDSIYVFDGKDGSVHSKFSTLPLAIRCVGPR